MKNNIKYSKNKFFDVLKIKKQGIENKSYIDRNQSIMTIDGFLLNVHYNKD